MIVMHPSTRTYTTGEVARALELPVRRLEGWAEQGLVAPRKQRGRTRHGDRRIFSFGDVMTVAVLAEVQSFLGATQFRPGGIADLVATTMRPDPWGLMASAGDHRRPAILVLHAESGKLTAEVLYRADLGHVPPAGLVVNLTFLAHKVGRALNPA